jgi:hypothetical protein
MGFSVLRYPQLSTRKPFFSRPLWIFVMTKGRFRIPCKSTTVSWGRLLRGNYRNKRAKNETKYKCAHTHFLSALQRLSDTIFTSCRRSCSMALRIRAMHKADDASHQNRCPNVGIHLSKDFCFLARGDQVDCHMAGMLKGRRKSVQFPVFGED